MKPIIIYFVMVIPFLFLPQELIAGCYNANGGSLITRENPYTCPVSGGGVLRPKDACAKQGGGAFTAPRKGGKKHNAIDINATIGTSVLASKRGRIAVAADWSKSNGMGKVVIIDHEDGDYSIYGHLNTINTKKGKCVKASTTIGTIGFSGNAACLEKNKLSPHLHFAIIRTAKSGLADGNRPIGSAIKNGNIWLDFAFKKWGDVLDAGVKNPMAMIQKINSCVKLK